jgi:serine/threonine protein kinase/tetratricopeptide (TPR) repeat protein
MAESSSDREPIEELAESFLARFRAGERPSLTEYTAAHPELADRIRELFPALVEMEQAASAVGPATGPVVQGVGSGGATLATLGEFRIVREVGRGGMGVVYEAVQESLGRHVALKVFAPWTRADPELIERFQREARAAARLHHTNIVPVFGVGEHEGVLYYAMQFIQGQGLDAILHELRRLRSAPKSGAGSPALAESTWSAPLAATVARSLLSGRFASPATDGGADGSVAESPADEFELIEHPEGLAPVGPSTSTSNWASQACGTYARTIARVSLQVAEALAHAHGQGILHRDIKPSNLLLDIEGNIWVTDFGLAKSDDAEALTEAGDIVGTVRYMAPERFRGESGPGSDVYGLGVTIYELLTLRPAFDEGDRARLIDHILHDDPLPPRSLEPKIPRDLETIVLKAMAKHPADRYGSARALGEDLGRFLTGDPIQARAITKAERMWRWCRRNPRVALLTAMLVLVLTGGTAAASRQWWRAERNLKVALAQQQEANEQRRQADRYARKAHQAFDEAFTQLSESKLIDVPGAQPLRQELLSGAVKYYEEFLRQRGDDPEIQGDMAAAYFRVATIYLSLERLDEALEALRQGVDFVDRLCREYPRDPRWARRLAGFSNSFRALDSASIHLSNRLPSRPREAVSTMIRATELWKKLARDHDDLPGFQSDLAFLQLTLAAALDRAKLDALALAAYQDARAVAEQLARRDPGVLFYQVLLTYTYPKIVRILTARRRFKEAEGVYRAGVALLEKVDAGPQLGVVLQDLAAFLESQGRFREAEAAVQRAIRLQETARQPGPMDYRRDLAICYVTSARLARARPPESERFFRMAIAVYEELAADFPGVATVQRERADALAQLAPLLEDSQPEEAERAYRQALLIREFVVTHSPDLDVHWINLAEAFQTLISFVEARRPQELLSVCREASARFRRLPAAPAGGREGRLASGRLLADADRRLAFLAAETSPAEAADAGERAVRILKQIVTETSGADDRENLGHADFAWAWALRHSRRFKQAEAAYDDAWRAFATLADEFRDRRRYRHFLAITGSYMGAFQEAQGEPARAEPAYRQSVDLFEQLMAEVKDEEKFQSGLAHNGHLLGRLLLDLGRFKEAERPYRRALEIWEIRCDRHPEDLIQLQRCQTGLILSLLASGRGDEAEQVGERARDKLRELARAHPQSRHHRVLVQWFLTTCPDARLHVHDERAAEIVERALEAEPQNGFFRLVLPAALYRAGKWDAAIDALGKLTPPNGADSWPWFILAMAHWQRGERETARRWYDRAVAWMKENDPRDEELRGFRAEAERLGLSTFTRH